MAPMNLWEFHARVFSLTGGSKQFLDRDGATYKICMEKVQGKFTELTGGGMK